jgi:mannose-6-phosphate isomerase-like protein (cupin superfamily)
MIIGTPEEIPGKQDQGYHGGHGTYFVRTLLEKIPGSSFEHCRYIVLHRGTSIGDHQHTTNEELFIIISGHGTMQVDGEERKVSAGAAILNLPGSHHSLTNEGEGDLELFVGCATAVKV